MGMKALMPMLQAQIVQQNYQASTSASENSKKRKQEQQSAFQLQLYNYYVDRHASAMPSRIQCMITGQNLDCDLVTAAHLFPKARHLVRVSTSCVWLNLGVLLLTQDVKLVFPQNAALTLNIADVWHVRNGLLWANPWEKVRFSARVLAHA